MSRLVSGLLEQFVNLFGPGEGSPAGDDGIRVFFAPGRVNLIGEHTDYTGGYVFPASLTNGTWAVVRARRDGKFRFASTHFAKRVERDGSEIVFLPEDEWANYPKSVIREFQKMGVPLSGCDFLFHGNIPNGAGLSSSASIELATAVALRALAAGDLPMLELVKLAQRAENEFVGVNCGIMDPFAVGMGKANHAMLLKCDTLDYRYVPLALGDYRLVIADTNKRRGLADSKYNERRRECEEGFRILRQHVDAPCLGDVTVEQFAAVGRSIRSATIYRRVLHVVQENERVRASQKALEAGDLHAFGQLMIESHESLRDLYEVTGFELDALFEAARKVDGCIGTRMTGAGFGGCTVSLVHREKVPDFQLRVAEEYQAKTGLTPAFYICEIGDGAREVTGEVERCLY